MRGERELEGKTFTFPASYGDVWQVALGTLEAELIPLHERDEIRGFIHSEEFPIQKNEYRTWARNAKRAPSGFGTLHLKLFSAGSDVSKVNIAVDFQDARRRVIRKKGRHRESAGVFEDALAARIHAFLIAQKYPSLFRLVIGCDFRLDDQQHVYRVSSVKPGGLGEEQGFLEGDIIPEIDGQAVTISNFFPLLSGIKQNEKKVFTLKRGSEILELPVDIFYLSADLPWFGMRTEWDPLTQKFRIAELTPQSPAQEAGLQAGDVFLEEEGTPLNSWRGFYQAATGSKAGVPRRFLIERGGNQISVQITPEAIETKGSELSAFERKGESHGDTD